VTSLVVRRPPFEFDPVTTPFQWQPSNPEFGMLCNGISFVAPAFERWIVRVLRRAKPLIEGTAMEQEAEDFIRQEGQHARAHVLHSRALVARYPGLQEALDAAEASYRELEATESLRFQLAYIADIEATFTPLFTMFLNNEATLFRGGDERVASLFLWHFVEEIEHRTSAIGIYEATVPSHWYRVRVVPKVIEHIKGVTATIYEAFNEHVPMSERLVDARVGGRSSAFASVPKRQLATMGGRLLLSQLPRHDAENQPIPEFYERWCSADRSGADITNWYATHR
jgi:predicted metal-dependent hydrolase